MNLSILFSFLIVVVFFILVFVALYIRIINFLKAEEIDRDYKENAEKFGDSHSFVSYRYKPKPAIRRYWYLYIFPPYFFLMTIVYLFKYNHLGRYDLNKKGIWGIISSKKPREILWKDIDSDKSLKEITKCKSDLGIDFVMIYAKETIRDISGINFNKYLIQLPRDRKLRLKVLTVIGDNLK